MPHPNLAVQGLGMQQEDDDDDEGAQCPSQLGCAGFGDLGMQQEEDDDDEGSQCPSQPRCAGPRLTPGSS